MYVVVGVHDPVYLAENHKLGHDPVINYDVMQSLMNDNI